MTAVEIRALRGKLGWTQMALAEAVGVTSNTVARWERGEMAISEPASRLLQKIAAEEKLRTWEEVRAPWLQSNGSIENGCKGENCECAWRLDYRPLGTRGPRKRLYFPTKKAAEKHLAQTSIKVTRGEYLDRRQVPTFAVTAGQWLESKMDRRPSYTEALRARLNIYLLPRFGPLRLDQVSVAPIEKMRDDMRELGRSTITINATIRMIGGIYQMAIRRGLCTANPADRVERAFAGDRELNGGEDIQADQATPETVLSPEEISVMLGNADPGLYKTLLTFLAATGLRSGEALALRWSDCQLGGPEPKIFVRRSLSWTRVHGEDVRPRFYPPKTKSGHRMITIPPELATHPQKMAATVPSGRTRACLSQIPKGSP